MPTTKNKNLIKLIDAGRKRPAKKPKRVPLNHVVVVLDQSSSMLGIRDAAAAAFEEQVDNLCKEAKKAKQPVNVNTITFSTNVNQPNAAFKAKDYRPDGWTALYDAINSAIDFGNSNLRPDDTLLIMVITDGLENKSKTSTNTIRNIISYNMANENFSIVAHVPRGGIADLTNIGIPAFNIREWDQTKQGVEELTSGTTRGYKGYFDSRAAGASARLATTSFMANMDAIDTQDINNMTDLSQDFKRWRVEDQHDGMEISDFVRSKKVTYIVANAFYELTKSEKVSAKKELLILDKVTGAVYGGAQARRKLGLPSGQDIRLKPGHSGEFTLFVQSTSWNRHLIGGTTLLYRN